MGWRMINGVGKNTPSSLLQFMVLITPSGILFHALDFSSTSLNQSKIYKVSTSDLTFILGSASSPPPLNRFLVVHNVSLTLLFSKPSCSLLWL